MQKIKNDMKPEGEGGSRGEQSEREPRERGEKGRVRSVIKEEEGEREQRGNHHERRCEIAE